MRLFLSSYRAGNHEDRLVELIGQGTEVGVITNAKDYKSPAERQQSVDEIIDFLSDLAMKPVEVDLRPHFNDPYNAQELIRKYAALWFAGGNTFLLRKALSYSGTDALIADMVRRNEIVFGGESAGAILATPSLTGVEFGDDPNIVPPGYKPENIMAGLGFVSYHLVPHYESEWMGAAGMIKTLESQGLEYKTLTNDQVVIINGDEEILL